MQGTQAITMAVLFGILAGTAPLAAQVPSEPDQTPVISDTARSSSDWTAERAKMLQAVERDLRTPNSVDGLLAPPNPFRFLQINAFLIQFSDVEPRKGSVPVRVLNGRSEDS